MTCDKSMIPIASQHCLTCNSPREGALLSGCLFEPCFLYHNRTKPSKTQCEMRNGGQKHPYANRTYRVQSLTTHDFLAFLGFVLLFPELLWVFVWDRLIFPGHYLPWTRATLIFLYTPTFGPFFCFGCVWLMVGFGNRMKHEGFWKWSCSNSTTKKDF